MAAWQARAERRLLALLMRLPEGVKRRMAARLEHDDGSELDTDLRLLLALSALRRPLEERSVADARRFYDYLFELLDVPPQPLARLRDHDLALPGRRLRLREYLAGNGNGGNRTVLFFHGGGHVIGSTPGYDRLCGFLSRELEARIFSLEYRLAPEHPFPAAPEDALEAWQWLHRNARVQDIDPEAIAVMGDSAGGNLAAVVSANAARYDTPVPVAQCLVYPVLDLRMAYPSVETHARGAGLTRELMDWFRGHYLQDLDNASKPLASPLLEEDFSGLPPTLLTICRDPLRDEGLEYVHRLAEAGVTEESLDFPELVHGFIGMGGMVPAARDAVLEICDAFGRMLASAR